jgi:hypothetical protein
MGWKRTPFSPGGALFFNQEGCTFRSWTPLRVRDAGGYLHRVVGGHCGVMICASGVSGSFSMSLNELESVALKLARAAAAVLPSIANVRTPDE